MWKLKIETFMDKSKTLQKATLGGSLLAAITASLCCIGPLVAVALGAGGFAASAVFEKWRPVFLGVTFALLALAWYLTYRKPKADCAEGAACATKPVSKWNKMVLWFATGVVFLMAAFPSLSSAILRASQTSAPVAGSPPAIAQSASSDLQRVIIPVEGMTCATCEIAVHRALKQVQGVENAQVSAATSTATVDYEPAKTDPGQLVEAINTTGYRASLPQEKK